MNRTLIRKRSWMVLLALVLGFNAGCYQRMAVQPKVKPQQANGFFSDGRGTRPLEIGTIARPENLQDADDHLQADGHYYTGKKDGAPIIDSSKPETVLAQYESTFPARITVDEEFLRRGRERYNIFCAVCHGQTGNADGTIVQRGFLRPPAFYPVKIVGGRDGEPSEFEADYHSRGLGYLGAKKVPLWKAPSGYIFSVISNGYGSMGSYSAQIPVNDRWAIVAYIRALQYSQSEQARKDLESLAKAPAETANFASTNPEPNRKDGKQ